MKLSAAVKENAKMGGSVGMYVAVLTMYYKSLSMATILLSLGVGLMAYSFSGNCILTSVAATAVLFAAMWLIPKKEGFNTHTPPVDVSALLRKMKSGGMKENFTDSDAVSENIAKNGYGVPGFGMAGPLVEGYEDVKKEKDEKPAPAEKKSELPMPFTLGEIPSQAKNGPHIDAGSTLIKAIQGLNPEQINAMTKDTQQLIETQKSLMGMLGTMKPMLNDGKQLMETFQQMFGQ